MRRAEARHRTAALFQFAKRLGDRFAQRAAGPHQLPLARQRLLVVGLGSEGFEFLYGVAQEFLVAPRRLGRRLGVGECLIGAAPCCPGGGNGSALLVEAGERRRARHDESLC